MIRKQLLDNGVRLLTRRMESLRSVSVGVWGLAGSRHEADAEAGVAHFLEHMFFKGTRRRTPYEIALESNRLGSHVNAYTSQEAICLYARATEDKLEAAADLLCDMLVGSTFDAEELERERSVILEEVMMYEDQPDERVGDLFTETLWEGHPLGRSILGRTATLRAATPESLRAFRARKFRPETAIVSVAGALDHEAARELFASKLGGWAPEAPAGAPDAEAPPEAVFKTKYTEKPLEQIHFCFGVVGPRRDAEERYALAALNLILGGGMSSRLFQEVREKRGLAYSIGSYAFGFVDTGYLAVSGGATPENLGPLLDICWRETRRLAREDVTDEELRNAKDMMRASLLLSLEGSSACMTRLAETEIYHGRYITEEETLDKIEALTAGDLRDCAERYLKDQPVAAAFIGPPEAKRVAEGRERF